MKKKYDEASVTRMLGRNPAVVIDWQNKMIEVQKNSQYVGNGTFGKLDYLSNYCGYTVLFVTATDKMKKRQEARAAKEEARQAHKAEKHKKSLNLVKRVKDRMSNKRK